MRKALTLALSAAACTGVALGAGLLSQAALAQNDPIYNIKDGLVDQKVFNGYRRYGDSCHRCHGPDGAGSSYAPDLTHSLQTMSYEDFASTVINGRQNVNKTSNNVMPGFGTTEDVALYIDDIYGYLKARSDGVLPRGRPKRMESSG